MRIQNTTNSIANAICRFCVKGLSVLNILSSLHSSLWRSLPMCVGLPRCQSQAQPGLSLALARTVWPLTTVATQTLGDFDAKISRYCDCLSGKRLATVKRLAMATSQPATLEARMERQPHGNPCLRFRSPV